MCYRLDETYRSRKVETENYKKTRSCFAKVASELLPVAEKYQMDELKDLCEQQLIASTDMGNAVAHLFLANRFKGQCHVIAYFFELIDYEKSQSLTERDFDIYISSI
jgi:hypothetical protein